MYKDNTFLAVIPARGGSKGIPKKNLFNIKGKPLISYTIDEALRSRYVDKIVVSTDCQEIADVAQQNGAEVPFLRPGHLAADDSKTIDVLLHAVNQLAKNNERFDYIVLLQPTQPLRKYWHIDHAIEQAIEKKQSDLVSVSVVKDHPLLIRSVDEKGTLQRLLPQNSTVRRQEFIPYYKVNGAIYINKLDGSFHENVSLNDNSYPFFMDKKYDLDIDDMDDINTLLTLV